MVSTTVQHSYFPTSIVPSPYVIVTNFIWKASISAGYWYQNTPYFPSCLLASNLASMRISNYLLIPACNLSLWYCKYFEAQGYNFLTPTWVFHNSWVLISVRGVVEYLPSLSPHIIGGTYCLKAGMLMDCYFVLQTLFACTPSLCDSTVDTVSTVTNSR